jgi:hypothetical protein
MRSGVFRSDNGGKHWAKITDGLRTRSVHNLAISADGGTLYAGTRGEGAFRLDLDGQPPPVAPPVIQVNPTATEYVYLSSTSTPTGSAPAEPKVPDCRGAIMPLGLVFVSLLRRRRSAG